MHHCSPCSDEHQFQVFSKAAIILLKFQAELWTTRLDKKKTPRATLNWPHPETPATPPLPTSPQRWWWWCDGKTQEITETHFTTPLICFDVSTSKKPDTYTYGLQINAVIHGLKSTHTLFCLTFDFWTHIIHRKITGQWGYRKLHLNIIPALHILLSHLLHHKHGILTGERFRLSHQ